MVRKILFFTLLLMQVQTVISAPLLEDRLIPVDWQQKRYSFLEGMPAILLYEARKLNDEKIDNLILELELPACLALVGADSTNPVRNSKTSFKGDVIRKTKEGIYQIVLDQAFVSKLSKSYHWMNYERI